MYKNRTCICIPSNIHVNKKGKPQLWQLFKILKVYVGSIHATLDTTSVILSSVQRNASISIGLLLINNMCDIQSVTFWSVHGSRYSWSDELTTQTSVAVCTHLNAQTGALIPNITHLAISKNAEKKKTQ